MRMLVLLSLLTVGVTGCGNGNGNGDMMMATSVAGVTADIYTNMPIPGAMVCVYYPLPAKADCVVSNAMGAYHLDGVPVNQQLLIAYELGGYLSALVEVTTTMDPVLLDHLMIKQSDATADAMGAGVSANFTESSIAVNVFDSAGMPLAGATGIASNTPDPTDGPYYFDPPTRKLNKMATTAAGSILWLNFTAADSEVTVSKGATPCTPRPNTWPGMAANSAHAKLFGGFTTTFAFACP